MSSKGSEYNGLYAVGPRNQGFCGLRDIPSTLEQSLINRNFPAIRAELSQFKNLPRQLQGIADRLHIKDIFSLRVARQYWLKEHNRIVIQDSNGNLDNVNVCSIRPATVVQVKNSKADVNILTYTRQNNSIRLTNQTKTVKFNPQLVPDLRPGQIVVCHWNVIVKPITPKEQSTIIKSTRRALSLF